MAILVYWFVCLTPTALIPLCVYLMGRCGEQTGIGFVDATSIAACHNRRIHHHKVFRKVARCGKISTGWFYGSKQPLVITKLLIARTRKDVRMIIFTIAYDNAFYHM